MCRSILDQKEGEEKDDLELRRKVVGHTEVEARGRSWERKVLVEGYGKVKC
jgi:hypothetical protein